jgi:hypothetical protein
MPQTSRHTQQRVQGSEHYITAPAHLKGPQASRLVHDTAQVTQAHAVSAADAVRNATGVDAHEPPSPVSKHTATYVEC